jgi:hypothetical protein
VSSPRAQIEESIDRLRPLATEALLAIFGQRMSAQIESAFGQAGHRLPASPEAPEAPETSDTLVR